MKDIAVQCRALRSYAKDTTEGMFVRLAVRFHDERGDIPGWVMVTVMTAMLVAAIGTLAEAEFKSLLSAALDKVRS